MSSFLILTIGGGAECMFVCLSFVLSEYDDIRLFVDQHCVLSTFVWMAQKKKKTDRKSVV